MTPFPTSSLPRNPNLLHCPSQDVAGSQVPRVRQSTNAWHGTTEPIAGHAARRSGLTRSHYGGGARCGPVAITATTAAVRGGIFDAFQVRPLMGVAPAFGVGLRSVWSV